MWTKQGLLELIDSKLKDYRLILVSNREPYIHRYAANQIECDQPASGLALALDPIMRTCGGTWIAHGSGDADREMVNRNNCVLVPPDNPTFKLRRVWLTKEQEMRYYYGLANQGLWPLCHVVFKRPVFDPEEIPRRAAIGCDHDDAGGMGELFRLVVPDVPEAGRLRHALDGGFFAGQKMPACLRSGVLVALQLVGLLRSRLRGLFARIETHQHDVKVGAGLE